MPGGCPRQDISMPSMKLAVSCPCNIIIRSTLQAIKPERKQLHAESLVASMTMHVIYHYLACLDILVVAMYLLVLVGSTSAELQSRGILVLHATYHMQVRMIGE
jgi:hypothetical protein